MAVDNKALITALSRFAWMLPTEYDVATALDELVEGVTEVLGLTGAGVTLESEGMLRFMTAHSERIATVERMQEIAQQGPCVQAHTTGDVVAVADLRECLDQWPQYAQVALQHRIRAVAGIPMRLGDNKIGTIDLYNEAERCWSGEDLEIDRVAADRPYYSGEHPKHCKHGMNLQVIVTPDGEIVWVSGALPGSVHDAKAAWIWRVTRELATDGWIMLGDKGCRGVDPLVTPGKDRNKPEPQKQFNLDHARLRGSGERANAQLETWKILQELRCCPHKASNRAHAIHALQERKLSPHGAEIRNISRVHLWLHWTRHVAASIDIRRRVASNSRPVLV